MSKLNIFVSSTCYDLSQIRTDLYESIAQLGHNPILSEYSDFPVNPLSNTTNNCIEVINSTADVLVLILGNRYGYKLDTGKSITNLEFLAAKAKGIPIYIFITKQILNILPVYLANKNSDYSNIVDQNAIFEFANELRNESGLWTFEFEKFQDIFLILKNQLSYLFKSTLTLRTKLASTADFQFLSKLSNRAQTILLEKGFAYEIEFFAQVLMDEILKYEILKNDAEYRIILKHIQTIKNDVEFIEWTSHRLNGTLVFLPNILNLINVLIPKFINEPGKPSDLKGLFYTANAYGRVYESFVTWSIDTLSVTVLPHQQEVRDALADLTSSANDLIWNLPFQLMQKFKETQEKHLAGETNLSINLDLTLEIDSEVMNRYNRAFEIFQANL